ncbi:MAG: hypothetical protein ACYST6_15965 [Planctomycetota bacterium]|jgi:antitoxin component YwqK of YwqJK toxin-antitoxin module
MEKRTCLVLAGVILTLVNLAAASFTDPQYWSTYDPGANGLGNDLDGYFQGVFDGRYVYFAPFNNGTEQHGEVLRYDTWGEFEQLSSWQTYDPGAQGVGKDPDGYAGALSDGRYVYFVPYHNDSEYHGEVLRYDTNSVFDDPCSWSTFDAGDHNVGQEPDGYIGAVFDGRYIYFVPARNNTRYHGEVLRYDTNAIFEDPCSWTTFDPGDHNVGDDPDGYAWGAFDGRSVYFVPYYNGQKFHGEVLRYDTNEPFEDPCSWVVFDVEDHNVGNDPNGYAGAAFDGRYIYFAPLRFRDPHGEVLRYDTSQGFSDLSAWAAYDPGHDGVGKDPDGYAGAVFEGRYVYFVPYYNGSDQHGEVLRYDTTGDFNNVSSWSAFDPNDYDVGADADGFDGAVFDCRYIYFVPAENGTEFHGEVLRYDTDHGDFDADCDVDWHDLRAFLDYWVTRCSSQEWCDGRDFNRNGEVVFDDFAIIASYWLKCSLPPPQTCPE